MFPIRGQVMTPQQHAFLPPFTKACLEWEASSTFPFKRQITIVSIAQGGLETGWGTSSLCKVNNYGGIKHHLPQWPGYSAKTREVLNGKDVTIRDSFQTYPTITDYINDHAAQLLRWKCVRDAAGISLVALCDALGPWTVQDKQVLSHGDSDASEHANYSTDPKYGSVLLEIIEGLSLDKAGVIEAIAV